MLLRHDYQYRLTNYMNISKNIEQAEQELDTLRSDYAGANRYTRTVIDDITGNIYTAAYPLELAVCDFVSAEEKCLQRIKDMKHRQRHFKLFLGTLSSSEYEYMETVYKLEQGYNTDAKEELEKRLERIVTEIESDITDGKKVFDEEEEQADKAYKNFYKRKEKQTRQAEQERLDEAEQARKGRQERLKKAKQELQERKEQDALLKEVYEPYLNKSK